MRTGAAAFPLAGLLILALTAGPAAAAGPGPELLLSWGAPYGQNNALSNVNRDCADSTAADTLYLSYRLREAEPVMSGMTTILFFSASLGDTMSPPWHHPGPKVPFLHVEFPKDTTSAFRRGWTSGGFGDWRYYPERNRGIVRMIYAVPANMAQPIAAGRTFCFARVILDPLPKGACAQPLCVEWREAKFSFSINERDVLGEQVHDSFVSVNSATGLACGGNRRAALERAAAERAARAKH